MKFRLLKGKNESTGHRRCKGEQYRLIAVDVGH